MENTATLKKPWDGQFADCRFGKRNIGRLLRHPRATHNQPAGSALEQKSEQRNDCKNADPEEAELAYSSPHGRIFSEIVMVMIQDCHWRLPTLPSQMLDHDVIREKRKRDDALQQSTPHRGVITPSVNAMD